MKKSVLILLIILFVIITILFIWIFRKKSESYITAVGGQQSFYCNIIMGIMTNLENQLKNAFPPEKKVGPITLTIFGKPVTFPDISKFTQKSNMSFNIPLTSIKSNLPPLNFSKTSDLISFYNSRSIWDSIFVSDNQDSENPFTIFLDPWSYVYSHTDPPVCSNAWGEILSMNVNNIIINDFASTLRLEYDKNICSTLENETMDIDIPFTITCNPKVFLKSHARYGHGSGNCVETHFGKCDDPSSSCFWNQCKPTSKCHHDHSYTRCQGLDQPCPNAQTHITKKLEVLAETNSSVHWRNNIHCNIGIDSDMNVTISNINIVNHSADYNMDSIHLNSAGSSFESFIKKHHLETIIADALKPFLNNIIKDRIPRLFDSVNSVLKDQKYSFKVKL